MQKEIQSSSRALPALGTSLGQTICCDGLVLPACAKLWLMEALVRHHLSQHFTSFCFMPIQVMLISISISMCWVLGFCVKLRRHMNGIIIDKLHVLKYLKSVSSFYPSSRPPVPNFGGHDLLALNLLYFQVHSKEWNSVLWESGEETGQTKGRTLA
jgi:hypothetical protein